MSQWLLYSYCSQSQSCSSINETEVEGAMCSGRVLCCCQSAVSSYLDINTWHMMLRLIMFYHHMGLSDKGLLKLAFGFSSLLTSWIILTLVHEAVFLFHLLSAEPAVLSGSHTHLHYCSSSCTCLCFLTSFLHRTLRTTLNAPSQVLYSFRALLMCVLLNLVLHTFVLFIWATGHSLNVGSLSLSFTIHQFTRKMHGIVSNNYQIQVSISALVMFTHTPSNCLTCPYMLPFHLSLSLCLFFLFLMGSYCYLIVLSLHTFPHLFVFICDTSCCWPETQTVPKQLIEQVLSLSVTRTLACCAYLSSSW